MFFLLFACVPGQGSVYYEGGPPQGADRDEGLLQVAETALDFDAVHVASPQTRELTLSNPGAADVVFAGLVFETAHFTLTLEELTLNAGGSTVAEITFAPETAGEVAEQLLVLSDTTPLTLDLSGLGVAPILYVPDEVDLGEVALGCVEPVYVTLVNEGNDPLIIESAELIGTGFSLPEGELPLYIGAGRGGKLTLDFEAQTEGPRTALLRLTTNDPAAPLADVDLSAMATWGELREESFSIGSRNEVDVLWYASWGRPSRGDGNEVLSAALADDDTLEAFFDALDDAELDWNLAIVGDYDGCLEGPVIRHTATRAGQMERFREQICPGDSWDGDLCTYSVSAYESPSYAFYSHLRDLPNWGCEGDRDWMREDAELLMVGAGSRADTMQGNWSWYQQQIKQLAREDEDLIHFAGIGRSRASSDTCADVFLGWLDIVDTNGGEWLDMCTTSSFRRGLYRLVEDTVTPSDRVVLADEPNPDSVTVWLNGAKQLTGWELDGDHVLFDSRPTGSTVTVEYAPLQSCD